MFSSLPRSSRSSTHDVNVAILVQVVCLAALRVGVWKVQLSVSVWGGDLYRVWKCVLRKIKSRPPDSFAARAMHLETMRPVLESTVLIIPNLQALMKLDRSSTLSWREGSCLFFSVYLPGCQIWSRVCQDFNTDGSAALEPVSALEKDMLLASLFFCWWLSNDCLGILARGKLSAGRCAEMNDLEERFANGRTEVAILKAAKWEKQSDAEDGSDAVMRGIAFLIADESDSSRSIFGCHYSKRSP
jgi:hypothetical protein